MSQQNVEQPNPFYIYLNFVNRDTLEWGDNFIERELKKQFESQHSNLKIMKLSCFGFLNFFIEIQK